jgi:hypothetical protein
MVISQTYIDKMIETEKQEKKISCRDLEELIRAENLNFFNTPSISSYIFVVTRCINHTVYLLYFKIPKS